MLHGRSQGEGHCQKGGHHWHHNPNPNQCRIHYSLRFFCQIVFANTQTNTHLVCLTYTYIYVYMYIYIYIWPTHSLNLWTLYKKVSIAIWWLMCSIYERKLKSCIPRKLWSLLLLLDPSAHISKDLK